MVSSKPSLLQRLVEDVIGLDAGELHKALGDLKRLQQEASSGGRRRTELDPMAEPDEPGLSAWDVNYRRRQAELRQAQDNVFAPKEPRKKGAPAQGGRARQRKGAAAPSAPPGQEPVVPAVLSAPSQMPAGAPASRRGGHAVSFGGLPRGMLQHAFTLTELLGPPMSLRESWGLAAGNSWAYPTVLLSQSDAFEASCRESSADAVPPVPGPAPVESVAPSFPPVPARTASQEAAESPAAVTAKVCPDSLTAELLFRLTVRSVAADQKISPREYGILQSLRKVLHLDEELERTILQQERARAAARSGGPSTSEVQPTGLYAAAFRLAVADGVISAEERLLLEQLAELLKLGPEQKVRLEELR
jgi:uncharacterized tellurite resistance protein B-like protein